MAKKKMDNLAKDMIQCKKDGYGCHYGKWKAMQEPVPVVKQEIPDGWKVCKHCGKPFKPYDKRVKYCDLSCRAKLHYNKFLQKKREQRRLEKECNGQA